uniref:Ribosomal protein S2 n=1 Tax=Scytosiphon lomentaria TaxID=27967 RepID=A0A0U1XC74_SCYLO|nr:ribosomal protein S2 [Scytosiphon lomentaria]AIQ78513.1 ribosomal protein S2 [Scytosiphon lomentaria]
MLNKKQARLLSFFIGSSGYLVPRPYNEYVKISKTMHPFILGKRNIHHFYDLEKSLYGIRATMEVFKNIVASGGKILFVSNSFPLRRRFAKEQNINCIKWKRGSLAKSKDVDLVFLDGVEKENLVEAHRKCLLLVGVGSPTMSKISYPFNLNLESPLLSDWFLGAIYTTYLQGKKKKKSSITSLLGKGYLKNEI